MSTQPSNPTSQFETPPFVTPAPQQTIHIYTHGVVTWQCPHCLTITRTRINAKTWKVECAYQPCHRRWAFGYRLGKLNSSRNATPRDLTMPLNALYNHRSSDGVNELYDQEPIGSQSACNKDVTHGTLTSDSVTLNQSELTPLESVINATQSTGLNVTLDTVIGTPQE